MHDRGTMLDGVRASAAASITGTTVLQAALQLAEEFSIPVFPCRHDKRPYTSRGFKDSSCNLEQVSQFWERWPDALIGVPTGRASKLLVVDVDPNGTVWYSQNVQRLNCGRLHATRRGHHLLYRMPDVEIRNSAGALAPGIDVRAEGGYVIWWPAHGCEVEGSLEELTEPPQWLLDLLVNERTSTTRINAAGNNVREGARNDTLFRLAASLRRNGAEHAEIQAGLEVLNARCEPPLAYAELESIATSATRYAAGPITAIEIPGRRPLNWDELSSRTPPDRDWAIEPWLGMRYVTLLAGAGGTGKTSLAQAMASCLAVRREYLGWMSAQRTVLMWACEDDHNELWRRQRSIANWLNTPLSEFTGRLHLHSYEGAQVELVAHVDHRRLAATPMLSELREQIGDYKADVVVLDNIARLFAGNENDRHEVTAFIAMLTAAAMPTNAAVLLLGHPGKAIGSEYSGSTAWEGAVRSRLYLGPTLPDARDNDEDFQQDDSVRYLCRRKANYSSRDWRRIRYTNGVMVPETPAEDFTAGSSPKPEYVADVVIRSMRRLADMEEYGNASPSSPNYLPKLARTYKLLENVTEKQFAAAMRGMQMDKRLKVAVIGKYSNRTPKMGLVIAESINESHK